MPVVSEDLVGQRAELGLPSKRAAAGSCGMPVDTELHKAARDGARSHRFSRSFAHLGPSS